MNSPDREQVNHPDHYNQGDIECIDALESALGSAGYEGFCIGNALKYLWRAPHKGVREQDLRKARWYLDRLLPAHHGDVSTASVDRNVTGADVIDWADGIRGALGTEHASKVTAQEARIADAIVSAMQAQDQDAEDPETSRFINRLHVERWQYRERVLFCGDLRIATIAPSGTPSTEVIDEFGEWIAWALNSIAERSAASSRMLADYENAEHLRRAMTHIKRARFQQMRICPNCEGDGGKWFDQEYAEPAWLWCVPCGGSGKSFAKPDTSWVDETPEMQRVRESWRDVRASFRGGERPAESSIRVLNRAITPEDAS